MAASLLVPTEITLNVLRPNSGVVVYAKQYDNKTRVIIANLVCGSEKWVPSYSTASVRFLKPDGTVGAYDIVETYPAYSNQETYLVGDRVIRSKHVWECNTAISTPENWTAAHWDDLGSTTPAVTSIEAGKYSFVLTEQALTCPGEVLVELNFHSSLGDSTTLNFILNVEKSAPKGAAEPSSDYLNLFTEEVVIRYATNDSNTTRPTSGWSVNPPAVPSSQYLWIRVENIFHNGSSSLYYIPVRYGTDGSGGVRVSGTTLIFT